LSVESAWKKKEPIMGRTGKMAMDRDDPFGLDLHKTLELFYNPWMEKKT
jgi:hypothetical protein